MRNALTDHVAAERNYGQNSQKNEQSDPVRNTKDIHDACDAKVINHELDEQRDDSAQAASSAQQ